MAEYFGEGGDISFSLFGSSHEVVGDSSDEVSSNRFEFGLRLLLDPLFLNFMHFDGLMRSLNLLQLRLHFHRFRRRKSDAFIDCLHKYICLYFFLSGEMVTCR